jgi:DNA-binding sugar fermentation-stimulating protein
MTISDSRGLVRHGDKRICYNSDSIQRKYETEKKLSSEHHELVNIHSYASQNLSDWETSHA